MLNNRKVVFIGGGVMAEAMIKGLLTGKLVEPGQVTVAEPRAERAAELQKAYKIGIQADNSAAVEEAGLVVLSVKPQILAGVLPGLKGRIPRDALVLSIIAGAKLAVLADGLGHAAVVRTMPNTPAQIGQAMTVWTASPGTTDAQREEARAVLAALGAELFVEEEKFLDMATALSGSGPAYVFLFMEALVDAGIHLGFPRPAAEKLVLQTLKGSVNYALQTGQPFASLRNQVTSPGGTTAEALYFLEKSGFRASVSRAVWAAYQRSLQLGSGARSSEAEKH